MKNLLNHSQTILNNSAVFFALIDSKGKILEMNHSAKTILGTDVGKFISDISTVDTFTKDSFTNVIQKVCETCILQIVEHTISSENGTATFATLLSPIQDESGKVIQVLVEGQNITQQKQYEQKLITEQTFKDQILNNAADGIVVFDAQSKLIFTNDAAAEIAYLKYYADKGLQPIDVFDFFTIDGSRRLQNHELILTKVLKGIEVRNFEQIVKLKDDLPVDLPALKEVFTPQSLSVSSRVIRGEAQEILGTVISYKDITEQKAYEQKLIQEQTFTNAILNNTAEGISVFDANGNKTYINEVARELTGLNNLPDLNSLQIENPYEFYTIDGRRKYSFEELPLGLAIHGIEVQNFEEIIQLKDVISPELSELRRTFKPRSLSVNSRIIKNDKGDVLSIIISYKDITERKENEQALVKVNQRLDSIREEERKRLARELHDGVIQDLMGFSYQLANYESLLNKEDGFSVASESLQEMRNQLTTSIKELRSFVSDLRPVGLEEFGFQPALESYIAFLKRDYQTKNRIPKIILNIEDIENLPISINLCLFRSTKEALANIIYHAKANQVTISLSILNTDSLVLSIEDDGVGFNVPDPITDFSKYQMFGLIGIQEAITLLEGELKVQSQLLRGTTLRLVLPLQK